MPAKRCRPENHKPQSIHPLAKHRPCLTCGKQMWSQGPHNRRCTACRAEPEPSVFAPGGGGGLPWREIASPSDIRRIMQREQGVRS